MQINNNDQYNRWVYPDTVNDIATAVSNGWFDFGDPKLIWPLYWPDEPADKKIKILVAGCGAHQAAYYAFQNPHCDILAIDISDSALEHHFFLKHQHRLDNLQIKKIAIENLNLKNKFDLIICTGVLHHLADPLAGLLVLKKHLAKSGIMNLMVYGKFPRIGVYMMQEVFRLLQLQQTSEDIATVKDVLSLLPPWHHAREFVSKSPDMKYDAGVVDIFLHRQDRAYTVNQVFDLIDNAGLEFVDWTDRIHYSVNTLVSTDHYLHNKAIGLDIKQRASFVELITQTIATHRFLIGYPGIHKRVILSYDTAATMYPTLRHGTVINQGLFTRGHAKLNVDEHQIKILSVTDGKNSVVSIAELTKINLHTVINFLLALDEAGHIIYSHNSVIHASQAGSEF